MGSEYVDENSDIALSELADALFIPELYLFDYYINASMIAAINANPNGTRSEIRSPVSSKVSRTAQATINSVSVLPARYLNRLSDLLFILSRVANPDGDVLWKPGGGTNPE